MTTINPTQELKKVTIRKSDKVDEDILTRVAKSKGISKLALQMRFPKPELRNLDETDLEHHERLYEKTFKMVKQTLKKTFPESPENPKFDVEERIDFLKSIGYPAELQVMERDEVHHRSILDSIERHISKFEFKSYLFDRASRTAIASFDVGNSSSSSPEQHVVILLDEDIKSKNYKSRTLAKPTGRVKYYIVDFYQVAATLLLRKMIVDFVNSRHDLAKYAILNFYSTDSKLFKLTIKDDSLQEKVIAYAESLGYEMRDINKRGYEYAHLAETILERIMTDKKSLNVSQADYLYDDGRALAYVILTKEFLRFMNSIQDKIQNLTINREAAATPYQSKKHQTQVHIDRASNSRLLEYFSKIEIDGDVELEDFDLVEKAFRKMFKNTPLPKVPGSSFRLRKLGREKAAGMYYVEPKAVVVDFRGGLKSCVHELMHHFDYTYEETRQEDTEALHESLAFRELYDRYVALAEFQARTIAEKEVVGKANDDEIKFHTAWNGNSKYNKAYYLREEEVFARLGEVVMALEFGARQFDKNVLFKSIQDLEAGTLHQIIYPVDKRLIKNAITYYERTLPFLFPNKKG